MKPGVFELHRPRTLEEALTRLADADGEGKALAGGQSLIALMNFRLAQPEVLVDLNPVTELAEMRQEADGLHLGAMVRQRTVERSDVVARGWPLLAEAMPFVAHGPIRNRGTVGGSLAHADSSAELCGLALALDARLVARSPRGQREISTAEFFVGPFMTILEEDELLTEVVLPPMPPGCGSAFLEVARRSGDFAMAGTAAVLTVGGDGAISSARLAYISLGSTAVRATRAEAALVGQPPTPEVFAVAADLAVEQLRPSSDIHASADYRSHLARVLTKRVLPAAHARLRPPGTDPAGDRTDGC